jgi:hypothetical protein
MQGMPRGILATSALLLAVLVLANPLQAQSAGRGFLFKTPTGSFTLRGGFAHANAGSDIFSDATSRFTIDKGDFSGLTVGGDLALRVAPRFDAVLGVGYASATAPSESRGFLENGLPIRQTTTFRRIPVTASMKAYLTPRGRSIGRFAWVPAKYALYAGGGVGIMRYSFEQSGDFVDDQTLEIHTDRFQSSGWTPEAQGMAGIELSLSPRFALTGEGRYTWAKADPSRDFANFSRIDLSGFAATAGISVRF